MIVRLALCALLLSACSNKDSTSPDSSTGKPAGLACTDAIMGCACVPATTLPAGTCSKASLGGAAQCCQRAADGGVVESCFCAKHGGCQQQTMSTCICTSTALNPEAGAPMTSCTKPMMGKCCKKVPDGSAQAECRCITATMCAMDEMEVAGCANTDTAYMCPMGSTAVESCQ